MRMARVNITIPDELLLRARAEKLNVSALAATALEDELDRRAKVAALDAYLTELDRELGPVPAEEAAAAREWVDGLVSNARTPRTRRSA
jgi:predicted transcriptional regulator